MAGLFYGAVIVSLGVVAYRYRMRLQAFAAGMHSDRYATLGTWALIASLWALGAWTMIAGAWSILN
jgi:hypothetical protein